MNCEYSHYDPYTITGRPSNHFNGINYAALNSDQRHRFITRYVNGFLINVDFSGFHLFLLHLLIGLDFPDDIYKSLSVHYPPDVNPKDHTFKQIYGGIDESLLDISPFKEIDTLSIALHERYKQGNLTTLLHGKPIQFQSGLSRSKLLSYLLQNLETEFNSGILDELVQSGDELILYTYDSFLFDVSADDLAGFIDRIKSIFSGIPYKVQIGRNYGTMKTVAI